jgi:hypothetical protein
MTGGRRLLEALCLICIILVHKKWGDFSIILVSIIPFCSTVAKCVNTTIKRYSKTVSIGGWWSLTNIAAYNIIFGCIFSCNFFGTTSYVMDWVGQGKDDRGSNNTQNVEMAVVDWYMQQSTTSSCTNLCKRYRCWFFCGICTYELCMGKSTTFHWKF